MDDKNWKDNQNRPNEDSRPVPPAHEVEGEYEEVTQERLGPAAGEPHRADQQGERPGSTASSTNTQARDGRTLSQEERSRIVNDRRPEPQPRKKRSSLKSGIVGGLIGGATVALLGGGLLFGSGLLATSGNSLNETGGNTGDGTASVTNVAVDVSTDTTEAVEKMQDAVVSVINLQESSGNPFGFTLPQSETEGNGNLVTASEGSGVIYKVDGDTAYVVTNNHVIDGADAVDILMKDGTKKEATVVGSDIWTDLAVLSVSSEAIDTVATFGDSDELNVGEPAIAIGSPLGSAFATSVTQGIISATERSVETDVNGDGVADWDVTVIQTDASINPGNSGGALINIAGQVIGINSMKIADATVEGMGFAIPSNDVVDIIAELEANGEVIRPMLGVSMIDLNQVSVSQQRNILNVPEGVTEGVVVVEVQPLSSAEQAGLQEYDLIVEMDGQSITDMVDLRQQLYSHNVGDTIEIKFYRDGELQSAEVELTNGQNNSL